MSIETEVKNLTAAVKALTAAINGSAAAPAAPAAAPAAPAAPAPAPAAESTMTIDEVRAKLLPIVQEKGPEAIEGPLKTLGVGMLSELDPSKFGELLTLVGGA